MGFSGLAPSEVKWVAGQFVLALEAIHGLGLLHRDIKPANMLLVSSAEVECGV